MDAQRRVRALLLALSRAHPQLTTRTRVRPARDRQTATHPRPAGPDRRGPSRHAVPRARAPRPAVPHSRAAPAAPAPARSRPVSQAHTFVVCARAVTSRVVDRDEPIMRTLELLGKLPGRDTAAPARLHWGGGSVGRGSSGDRVLRSVGCRESGVAACKLGRGGRWCPWLPRRLSVALHSSAFTAPRSVALRLTRRSVTAPTSAQASALALRVGVRWLHGAPLVGYM